MRLRQYFILFAVWCCSSSALAQDSLQYLTFLFVGDVMQHGPQIRAAYDSEMQCYDYHANFRFVAPYIQKADIAVANLEVTLAGPPFSGYPQFCAPDELAEALKTAGFEYIITANNHSCDKGKNGVLRTIEVLQENGFKHTGTFRTQQERDTTYPLIIKEKGFTVALLNYTYGTNGLPVPPPTVVNLIDTSVMKEDLAKARKVKPDLIVVTTHWGYEYNRLPNGEQKWLTEWLYDNGADMVIGAHPHVVQPMEIVKHGDRNRLVTYSLGNFISNQRKPWTDGGAMIYVEAIKNVNTGHVSVKKAGYIPTWVYIEDFYGSKEYYVLPAEFKSDSTTIFVPEHDLKTMNKYISGLRDLLSKHNRNVDEVTLAEMRENDFSKIAREYYKILLMTAKDDSFFNALPDYLKNRIHLDRERPDKVNYLLGHYSDLHVARGFLKQVQEAGFAEAKIITFDHFGQPVN